MVTATRGTDASYTAPMKPRTVSPSRARVRILLCALAFALGTAVAAHLAQCASAGAQSAPPRHPLTGRQIAGIATDAAWLDRAEREEEEEPERALDLIGITPGLVVADVGAGSGYMTVRLARRVGSGGKVYANDLQPAMLQVLRDRVTAQGLANVVPVQGTATDAQLPDGAIDLVLMVDVYHEMWHPQEMLQSLRRSLKPNGRLVLLEYRKEDPTVPIRIEHKMSLPEVRREVGAEGFAFERAIPGLPRQHIIVFRKPPG